MQLYHSQHYIERFTELISIGVEKLPSLRNDQEFVKNYERVIEVINGTGDYNDIINGEEFRQFKKDLNNPSSRLNLVPRTAKRSLFIKKK